MFSHLTGELQALGLNEMAARIGAYACGQLSRHGFQGRVRLAVDHSPDGIRELEVELVRADPEMIDLKLLVSIDGHPVAVLEPSAQVPNEQEI